MIVFERIMNVKMLQKCAKKKLVVNVSQNTKETKTRHNICINLLSGMTLHFFIDEKQYLMHWCACPIILARLSSLYSVDVSNITHVITVKRLTKELIKVWLFSILSTSFVFKYFDDSIRLRFQVSTKNLRKSILIILNNSI